MSSSSKVIVKIQDILDQYAKVHPKTSNHLDEIGTMIKSLADEVQHDPHALCASFDLEAKTFIIEDYEISVLIFIRPKDGNHRYATHLLSATSPIQTDPDDDFARAMGLVRE